MLFKTTDELVEYASLSASVEFYNVAPTIRTVEEQHIIPTIGRELYHQVNQAYTNAPDEGTIDIPTQLLLAKLRAIIGPLTCYYYTPKAEVQLSDAGAQRMETGTAKTAYQNQVNQFKEANLRESETANEELLRFLEEKKADYPLWIASDAFKHHRTLFIRSGQEFAEIFPSASPFRNYRAMAATMQDVEEFTIRPLIGSSLFDALKSTQQDADGEFTAAEKQLLTGIKKAVAYLAVASAVPFLNVRVDAAGITVMSAGNAQDDKLATRNAATDNALNALISAAQNIGASWITNVQTWLKNNSQTVVPVIKTNPQNLEHKAIFGIF